MSFLIYQSGDEKILAQIADEYAGGSTFLRWLSREGARYRLGATLEQLEASWKNWLRAERIALDQAA